MGNLWLKIKVWTKVGTFAALVIYLLLFILNNGEQVTLWFWFGRGSQVTTSVLKLVLATFVIGALAAMLLRTTFTTIRQVRDIKRRNQAERLQREVDEMKAKAARLRPKPMPSTDPGSGSEPTGASELPP